MAPIPNFFLVGAPKSGTTSLAAYLGQHPSVYMSPIKEPCFFAPEVASLDPKIVRDWDEYLKLFAGVRGETAIGEGTVAYLSSLNAPRLIAERIPDARIIAVLRDPADRLFAHYRAARASRVTSAPFASWLDEQQVLEAKRTPRIGAVWAGYYAAHLGRYFEHFPRERVHLMFYEDFTRDPAGELRNVLAFLGVDSKAAIDMSTRHNVTTVPRWPALGRLGRRFRVPFHLEPSARERSQAVAIYRDDIRELGKMLHRDLSPWST